MTSPTHMPKPMWITETCFAFVDPSAWVSRTAKIWHNARVLQNARIGAECSIGGGVEIGRESVIGDRTRIGSGSFLPPNSTIGEDVFIGPNVTFTDDRHPKIHGPNDPPYRAQPPIVEHHASIGAACVILPGVRIGHHARIAAGSIVTKDVPPGGCVRCEPARAFEYSPETAAAWDAGRDW